MLFEQRIQAYEKIKCTFQASSNEWYGLKFRLHILCSLIVDPHHPQTLLKHADYSVKKG